MPRLLWLMFQVPMSSPQMTRMLGRLAVWAEAVLASKEIAAAVNAAIGALSEDLRQAVTLREIEGLSYEEISEVMNCPIGTVRSRIFRAREAIALRLRPMLDARMGERW